MSEQTNKVRAVVARLIEDDWQETPWVVACMALSTYSVVDEEEWQEWKRKALALVLPDWENYDIREVVLSVPQARLDALYWVDEIEAEVSS